MQKQAATTGKISDTRQISGVFMDDIDAIQMLDASAVDRRTANDCHASFVLG